MVCSRILNVLFFTLLANLILSESFIYGQDNGNREGVNTKIETVCKGNTSFKLDFGVVETGDVLQLVVAPCPKYRLINCKGSPKSVISWSPFPGLNPDNCRFTAEVPDGKMGDHMGGVSGRLVPKGGGNGGSTASIPWSGDTNACVNQKFPESDTKRKNVFLESLNRKFDGILSYNVGRSGVQVNLSRERFRLTTGGQLAFQTALNSFRGINIGLITGDANVVWKVDSFLNDGTSFVECACEGYSRSKVVFDVEIRLLLVTSVDAGLVVSVGTSDVTETFRDFVEVKEFGNCIEK